MPDGSSANDSTGGRDIDSRESTGESGWGE